MNGDGVLLYERLEALLDPVPPADAPTLAVFADFRRSGLRPRARQFPDEELRAFAACGLSRALVPPDLGGTLEWSRLMRLCTRIAAADFGLALVLGGTVLGAVSVLVAGNAEQRAQYFAPLLRGETGGLALSEWAHGSDLLAGTARAEPCNANGEDTASATHFRLNGEKAPINNGSGGANVVVLARTATESDAFATSLFLLARETKGLSAHPRVYWQGDQAMELSGVRMKDALVPKSALLGKIGEGFLHTRRTLEITRGGVATMAVGATCAVLALAHAHAHERKLYGAEISTLGGVQLLLARAAASTLLSIALCRHAARETARSALAARPWTCAAKLLCPALLENVVADAGSVLGARSLIDEFGFTYWRKNAPLLAIFDGSSQLQLDELWRAVAIWKQAPKRDATSLLIEDFDPHRDGKTQTPLHLLDADPTLAPFLRAATALAEQAENARQETQIAKFQISAAAAPLFALAALETATRSPALAALMPMARALVAEMIAPKLAALGIATREVLLSLADLPRIASEAAAVLDAVDPS